jgi:arylsulfatase A-like enzyme
LTKRKNLEITMNKPNIILILTDDLGWRDLGCYGSDFYETPNLDRLAAEGLTFTDAYASCPVCSPTRASILTGKYPATLGVTDWIDSEKWVHPARGKLVDAPYIDHLPLAETSLAKALKEGGYHTWHVGKWHLGQAEPRPKKWGSIRLIRLKLAKISLPSINNICGLPAEPFNLTLSMPR